MCKGKSINWNTFDADKEDEKTKREMLKQLDFLLATHNVSKSQSKDFIKSQIELYNNGELFDLNRICKIHCFKPHQYDHITNYDSSLLEFENWLRTVVVDWRKGSEELKKEIKKYWPSAGETKVSLGRNKSNIADDYIVIDDAKAVIEVETSINHLNGYKTISSFFSKKNADFGIMIVPWFPMGKGRVEESKALIDLDDLAENYKNTDNPIYRVAVIREIDLYKLGNMMP